MPKAVLTPRIQLKPRILLKPKLRLTPKIKTMAPKSNNGTFEKCKIVKKSDIKKTPIKKDVIVNEQWSIIKKFDPEIVKVMEMKGINMVRVGNQISLNKNIGENLVYEAKEKFRQILHEKDENINDYKIISLKSNNKGFVDYKCIPKTVDMINNIKNKLREMKRNQGYLENLLILQQAKLSAKDIGHSPDRCEKNKNRYMNIEKELIKREYDNKQIIREATNGINMSDLP